MSPVNVNIETSGIEGARDLFERAPAELHKALGLSVRDVADEILAESQKLVPVDRATLKKSGNIRYGDLAATVGYNTPYARAVHDGFDEMDVNVRAHTRRISMAFGRRIPSMSVNVRSHSRHIGPRLPRPYLDDAVKSVLPYVPKIFRKRIREALEKLRG